MIEYYLGMVLASFLAALAQVLMKLSSKTSLLKSLDWFLLVGGACCLFAIVVGITLWCYSGGMKVSTMYPLTSLGYVFGALLAWKILGETINKNTIIATLLIMSGVAILGIGGGR